jgi:hypothetical protein
MKTFRHNLVRYARTYSDLFGYVRTHNDLFGDAKLGTIYNIVEVTTCSGKEANSLYPCRGGGPKECPGYMLLDGPPFNISPRCYSWAGKSIFDFSVEE